MSKGTVIAKNVTISNIEDVLARKGVFSETTYLSVLTYQIYVEMSKYVDMSKCLKTHQLNINKNTSKDYEKRLVKDIKDFPKKKKKKK